MTKFARQAEYDHIVREIVQSGGSWEEATTEAMETFLESNYDVSSLYIYSNKAEYDEKELVEKRCRVIEDVFVGKATIVNMIFALQGLAQRLNTLNARNCIRLLESRRFVTSLINVLGTLLKGDIEDDEEPENSNGEDDDDDEDENKTLQKVEIWKFLHYFITLKQSDFLNYNNSISISEESANILNRVLDEDCDEIRVMNVAIPVLSIIFREANNREIAQSISLNKNLDLVKKMHKKNSQLCAQIDQLLLVLE